MPLCLNCGVEVGQQEWYCAICGRLGVSRFCKSWIWPAHELQKKYIYRAVYSWKMIYVSPKVDL